MLPNNLLKLLQYRVKSIDFKSKKTPTGEHDVQLNNRFNRTITKIDENTAIIGLSVIIDAVENSQAPFSLNVEIEGTFLLSEWEKPENLPIIENNTVAILFPYLRALVSTITANANIPPYTLPVVNIVALFSKSSK